jgi:fatty acid desaturase
MIGESQAAPNPPDATQAEIRKRVSSILSNAELLALRSLDVRWTFLDAAVIYLLLGLVLTLTWLLHASIGPWTLLLTPLLALISGVAFNWINVQIHEASHNLLLPNKAHNDTYCNWVLGALALQDVQTYRATHGMHHSQLHTAADPDRWVYTTGVGSTRQRLRGLLEDLSMWTMLKRSQQLKAFFAQHPRLRPRRALSNSLAKLLGQLVVLALFVASCGPWGVLYYGGAYLYGLLGVFTALVRIRTVVQHYQPPQAGITDPLAVFTSRSTVASFVQFLMVGARMDYHFEHHLYPNIPYYNLQRMHARLLAAGFFSDLQRSSGQQLHTDDYLQSFGQLTHVRAQGVPL